MSRLLRFPLATGGLLVLCLVLNQTLSLGQVILGVAIAVVGAWTLGALRVSEQRARQLASILRLTGLVLADIVRSNIAVAHIVLGRRRNMTSGFVRIPLDLRNSYGLAALACIITAAPGKLWVAFDQVGRTLTIHVLDLIDEEEWIRTIKGRYERLLLEIFP